MPTAAKACPPLTLRLMVPRDLPHVLRIEQQSHTRRWTVQDFLTVLQSGHTVGQVAEAGDQVVGFVIYTVPPLATVRDDARRRCSTEAMTLEVLNLAVAPQWRRQGIGKALLDKLARKLCHPGDCLHATVPESNLPAQLLLRSAGFRATRILRGYYETEDGYLMERCQ